MLLLVVSLVVYVVFYQRKISKQQEKHQHGLLSATIAAQEKERTRVAKELHDGVQQEVSAVKGSMEEVIDRLDPGSSDSYREARERLREAADAAEATVDDLRRISHDLLPRSLEKFGLAKTLKDLCNGMGTDGLTAGYTLNGTYDRRPPGVELALYRVVQEMATNTRKHAEANAFDVVLNCRDTGLLLVVSDNGKGYDPGAQKGKGLGLRNIESRLRNIRATYHVVSWPGEGTSITISL